MLVNLEKVERILQKATCAYTLNQAVRKYAALESNLITKLSGHNCTRDNIPYIISGDTNPAVVANKLRKAASGFRGHGHSKVADTTSVTCSSYSITADMKGHL